MKPYTRDDVLYARRCRGDMRPPLDTPPSNDNPLYCGTVGDVREYAFQIEYHCQVGVWIMRKTDPLEWRREISCSTMHITARRMCNYILGEPDLESTFDGTGKEWAYTAEDPRGPNWTFQETNDIAGQVGIVTMHFGREFEPKYSMRFRKDKIQISAGAPTLLEAHAQLFHAVLQEKVRRDHGVVR